MLLLILFITVSSISIYIFLEERRKERDKELMEKIRKRNIEMICELEQMRRDESSYGGLIGGFAISLINNNRKNAVGFKSEE